MSNKSVKIFNKIINNRSPCFIVAEIGINHNGELSLAKEMVQAAKESGADSVKFQNYKTDDFIFDRTLTHSYSNNGKKITVCQYDMFKKCEMNLNFLKEIKTYCDKLNIHMHSTPTSLETIRDLLSIGVDVLKNGSDYLTNLEFIEQLARTGLPLVLSTGMANLEEVEDAVVTFRKNSRKELLLLHCTSLYPTPPHLANIKKIPVMAEAFDCLVGFSDHTAGITAALGARVLGAVWLEKHFTTDKKLSGPDHEFSCDPKEFTLLVTAIRELEQNLGSSRLSFLSEESESRNNFRLSCVVNKDIAEGSRLKKEDIAFMRPSTGIPPKLSNILIGKILKKNKKRGEPISFEDI